MTILYDSKSLNVKLVDLTTGRLCPHYTLIYYNFSRAYCDSTAATVGQLHNPN